MLSTRIARGYNERAYNFGGVLTSALISSADCLTNTVEGGFLAAVIEKAGPGDYVEVGCGYGGTSILAAIVKQVFNAPGRVTSIDLFMDQFHTFEHATKNIMGWGLERHIDVVQANSYPWPLPPDRKFVVGYVDGNHRGDMPYNDLTSMSKCVEKYILVHDYDMGSRDVVRGANRFSDENPEWKATGGKKTIIVLERVAL